LALAALGLEAEFAVVVIICVFGVDVVSAPARRNCRGMPSRLRSMHISFFKHVDGRVMCFRAGTETSLKLYQRGEIACVQNVTGLLCIGSP
jgi:hypothetical protein